MQYYLVTTLAFAASVAYARSESPRLQTRNLVESISDEYDFVIVGGGLAGLVLGGRLSEDSGHSVLVLEAGNDGSEYADQINTPGLAYYNSLFNSPCDWSFHTSPQAQLNGMQMLWPRGKVLGGSSAINGMYLNRPGEIEVNAWNDLLGDMEGADNWTWDSLFASMKKSETFTPPLASVAKEGDITWDAASHGTSGPIHNSWPGVTFPMIADWSASCEAAGVATSTNTYGGENWGAYVATSAINPTNWTRSYSRSGYLDPLPHRDNYDVLANAQVTRILFDKSGGDTTASKVEYTSDGGDSTQTVKVKKEVILAGGTIGSPTVLLYSGVGPKDVLDAAGVDVVLDLPGVGQHLQDHISIGTAWSTQQPTAGSIYDNGGAQASNPAFLSFVNDAVAYINSSVLLGSGVNAMQKTILSTSDQYAPTDATVKAGYNAILQKNAKTILTSELGQVELLIGNTADGVINLGATLQHPFSMGSVTINSSNPMDYPVIDPNYLANPADSQILIEGLKWCRQIANTPPLSGIMTETFPGNNVSSDADWLNFIQENAFTEYHPCSTCAMLPRDQGGVVDANLKVYGLKNVRVADASVPPLEFSAHLMASTYGLAEKASEIIRDSYKGTGSSSSGSGSDKSASGSSSKSGSGSGDSSSSGSGSSSSQHNSASASGSISLLHIVTSLSGVVACIMFGLV